MQRIVQATSAAYFLKAIRDARDLPTIYAACKEGGISTGTWHRIEFNKQDPGVSCLQRIVSSLGGELVLVAKFSGSQESRDRAGSH
ncbi:MAG: hypothetical protein WCY37_04610 [Candidatus Dojkabacteria bacterium]